MKSCLTRNHIYENKLSYKKSQKKNVKRQITDHRRIISKELRGSATVPSSHLLYIVIAYPSASDRGTRSISREPSVTARVAQGRERGLSLFFGAEPRERCSGLFPRRPKVKSGLL